MSRRAWPALPLLILVAGIIAAAFLAAESRDRAEKEQDAAVEVVAQRLNERFQATVATLSGAQGLLQADADVRAEQFDVFARSMFEEPTLYAAAFLPRLPSAERRSFERRIGRPITEAVGDRRVRAPARREYLPVALVASRDSSRTSIGLNIPRASVRGQVLARARDSGRPRATPAVRLLSNGHPGLVIYRPLYVGQGLPATVSERRRRFRGAVAGGVDLGPLARRLRRGVGGQPFRLSEGGDVVLGRGAHLDHPGEAVVALAGRRFVLQAQTADGPEYGVAVTVLVSSMLLALLTAALTRTLVRREAYAVGFAAEKVAERDAAQQALGLSELKYRSLAEHSTDWIATCSPEGELTYNSPASAEVAGHAPADLEGRLISEFIHRDGVAATPAPFGEGPGPDADDTAKATFRLRGPGEQFRWLEASAQMVPDAYGRDEWQVAFRDVSERVRLEEELRSLADHDSLTGLANRRSLFEHLGRAIGNAKRGKPGVLLLVDLDDFKEVNDSRGHLAGDDLLREVAVVLSRGTRAGDVVARLGGDEFAIVLADAEVPEGVQVAEKLLGSLAADRHLSELAPTGTLTASVGVTRVRPLPGADQQKLLVEADVAMYEAKRAGRGRVRVFDGSASKSRPKPTHETPSS